MKIPGIIITGLRRSGTHLIYRLLDSHLSIFNSLVEVYLLEYLYDLSLRARECFVNYYFTANIDDLFDVIAERELLPVYRGDVSYEEGVVVKDKLLVQIDEEILKSRVESHRKIVDSNVQGIWNSWFASLQSVMCPDMTSRPVVVKSPDYGKSAFGALEFLPAFKIIFMVRNPIFALSSLRKLRMNQPHRQNLSTSRILSELSSYDKMYQTIVYLQRRHLKQVMVIRFEDLLNEPKPTLNALSKFLDIPYHEILLRPTFKGKDWDGDSSFERLTGLSKKPLDSSRIILTHKEIDMVTACLPKFLSKYGYHPLQND